MNRRQRVLIVDDDERVLFVLRRALTMPAFDYEIVTAGSSDDALRKAKEAPFDVVVTDLVMPGMDGMELTEAIKTQRPDTVVIWMTAFGNCWLRKKAERSSVYRCLEKPLKIAQIRDAVLEALESAVH
jgi:DNA-binding NtrC family response regulator